MPNWSRKFYYVWLIKRNEKDSPAAETIGLRHV